MEGNTITACTACGSDLCKQPKSVACRYTRMLLLLRREDFKRTYTYYCHDLFRFSDPCYSAVESSFISAVLEYQTKLATVPCPSATEHGVSDLYGDITVPLDNVNGWMNLYEEKKLEFSEVRCGIARNCITANELSVLHTNTTPTEVAVMVEKSWMPIEFTPKIWAEFH